MCAVVKDPWSCNSAVEIVIHEFEELKFEDNFNECRYQRLQDSEQYLAILENKLSKLKTGKKHKEKQDLIESVEQTCTSYITRLITHNSRENLNLNQDLQLDTPININGISSRLKYQLNPQQPITAGEIAELLKHDVLCKNQAANEI